MSVQSATNDLWIATGHRPGILIPEPERDALDILILEVQAEMPCYMTGCGATAFMDGESMSKLRCLPCIAREKLKVPA